jgi:hypothetical protein
MPWSLIDVYDLSGDDLRTVAKNHFRQRGNGIYLNWKNATEDPGRNMVLGAKIAF